MAHSSHSVSETLRRFAGSADRTQWPICSISQLDVKEGVLSFQCGLKELSAGEGALLVSRGSLRMLFPLIRQADGRWAADLSQTLELCQKKNRKPGWISLLLLTGTECRGWQLSGTNILGRPGKEGTAAPASSMLVEQFCRHTAPVAQVTVAGEAYCIQPYLQLETGLLRLQVTTPDRAAYMASRRWTQSVEEYAGASQFRFTVIATIEDSIFHLTNLLESLTAQTADFSKSIQLILCPLKGEEDVLALCRAYQEQYPKNVLLLETWGQTVAQARNQALARAEGEYLLVTTSRFSYAPETFQAVAQGAPSFYQRCDAFLIPVDLSGDQMKPYWNSGRFRNLNEYSLEQSPAYTQCILGGTFLKRETAQTLSFEGEPEEGGDTLYLLKLFLKRCWIASIPDARCSYYCQNKEQEPFLAEYAQKPGWYDRYFTCLFDGILAYCSRQFHWTPDFVVQYLIFELAYRFRQESCPDFVAPEEYRQRVARALRQVDEGNLIQMKRYLTNFELCQMMELRSGQPARVEYRWHDGMLRVEGTTICALGDNLLSIDFIELRDRTFSLEGYVQVPPVVDPAKVEVLLRCGSQWYLCQRTVRHADTASCFGPVALAVPFLGSFPITEEALEKEITVYLAIDRHLVRCRRLMLKRHCPLSTMVPEQYYYRDGLVLTRKGSAFFLSSCTSLRQLWTYEQVFLRSAQKKVDSLPGKHALKQVDLKQVARLRRKAILYRMNPKSKEVWLISDRINRGDDNGEVFFRYLQKEQRRPDRTYYFVIGKDCEDFKRIGKYGPVIDTLSEEHLFRHLVARWVVSSQANDPVLRPFGAASVFYRDLFHDGKFVFLQHGVTKDDQSAWLNRYNRQMEGFVVSTQPEYDSVFAYDYYHPEEAVWLTGMPRTDALYHDERNYLTIMPTWRKSLTKGMDPVTSVWLVVDNFKESEFFQFYNGLLNHPRLLQRAKELDYTICFKPHPNFLSVLDQFDRSPDVLFFPPEKSYREIYAQSKLLLTDYSSAVFDFALMKKPVVYAQFDAADFFSGGHSYVEGYFSYERDGFGEVEYDLESTVDRLIEYMERDCKLKPQYEERIDRTFAFRDRENAKRVFERMERSAAREAPVKKLSLF